MRWGKWGKLGMGLSAIAIVALTVAASPLSAGAKPAQPKKPSKEKKSPKAPKPLNIAPGIFGATIWEPPTSEEYQRMAAGGISHMKLLISANLVAPQPSTRDWRLYDDMVATASRAGITMDPWLFGIPSWMGPDVAVLPIWTPGQRAWWSGFVYDAARRYGPGGQFWAEHPDIPARPMHFWEVWNETNINEFTGRKVTRVSEYATLLAVTRAALKKASPANQVVLGGLYRRPKPGHGIKMSRYLKRLYKGKWGSLFDVVAIHPYASLPKQVLRITQAIRRVMKAYGDGRKPLWITELGWTTGGTYWAQSLYRATLTQQATRVAAVTSLLLAHRRQLRLQRIDWHTWRDLDGPNFFWDKYSGFFTSDGRPKPAWGAFTGVTRGTAGGPIRNVGHFVPFGTPPPGAPPPPSPPPGGGGRTCVLLIFCS